MLASHNSLTCYKSNFFLNLFYWAWKCQDMSFEEQLTKVDYFDIRVSYNKKSKFIFCHGLANLKVNYTLEEILNILKDRGKTCRVLLEKGEDKGLLKYLKPWIKAGVVKYVVIKKDWKVIYGQPPMNTEYYSFVPFYHDKPLWWNIKRMMSTTIKRYAKKHNPVITQEMIDDKDTVYFMDYIK